MIAAKDIRGAITALLKKHFPDHKVYFNNNAKAKEKYFYAELIIDKKTVDRVYYDRSLAVSLSLVLPTDANGRVDRAELYAAIDTLDAALLPVFQIGDRFITVLGTHSRIVDEVLHYSFNLDFTDFMPRDDGELMQTLYLNGITEDLSGD